MVLDIFFNRLSKFHLSAEIIETNVENYIISLILRQILRINFAVQKSGILKKFHENEEFSTLISIISALRWSFDNRLKNITRTRSRLLHTSFLGLLGHVADNSVENKRLSSSQTTQNLLKFTQIYQIYPNPRIVIVGP